MSKLHAFLHPTLPAEKEIVLSDRFRDEDGEIVAFRIRPLTQDENNRLVRASTKRKNGEETVDSSELANRLIVAATVFPDFKDSELCAAYGVLDPLSVPSKMLLSGEYAALSREIASLSGFGRAGVEKEAEEAKN